MPQKFPFKDLFLEKVKKTKGMVNCHAHLDRAYTLTPAIWQQTSTLMEEKWVLNREIKKKHTAKSIQERLIFCIEDFLKQGIIACRTHIDADSVVGLLVVKSAAKVREKYQGRFTLQLVAHPLEGFLNKEATDFDPEKIELYKKACQICDLVGGLPSRDRALPGGDKKHADFILQLAKKLKKDLDVHIDQENNPQEKDTEWFLDKIKDVTVCPTAAISMKQHRDKLAPVHNSITQVDEMLTAGVNVSIGTDNISDIFVPECNGDLFEEIQMLASACRLYDLDKLVEIATVNGYQTMKLNL